MRTFQNFTSVIARIPNFIFPKLINEYNSSIELSKSNSIVVKKILQIGIFGTFLGHGINAILVKTSWIHLITAFGFSNEFAIKVMPIIGIADVLIAISILLYPMRLVLIWAVFWAFITALSRPISGEPYIEFIERAANWAAPLVLLLLIKKQK